ncbi:efflux pump protein [Leptospira ryugenii]|uniref:Efflux pump protein n=1 Tax=Leptospira ryugenii TaxID=1917863 RepID=A0A2P2E4B5_9LEPT|nr:HlyD family efflux transporter periplasmic adaptor subunit [Leptospira ryugenii]GBF51696.1 efflux pump protein [Leptospira ryugenii]
MKLNKFKAVRQSESNWETLHSSTYFDELLRHPAPNWNQRGILLICGFLFVSAIFVIFAKIDIIVPAFGTLRPKGNYFVVEALETGTVTNIYAKPGDFLKKGDPLVELEFSEQQIELTKDANNLQYEEVRLRRLYQNKREAEKILRNLDYNLENNSGSELSGNLLNKFVPLKKSYMDFKNGVGAKFLYDQSLLEFNEEYTNLKDEILLSQNTISSLRGDTKIKKERVDNAILRMPFSGFVGAIMVNNIGQNVTRGQTVAELIEENQLLEAFVEVNNKDIGGIKVGMNAIIKVKAFNQNEFGVLDGKIEQIVPNVKEKETFSVVLSIADQAVHRKEEDFSLIPGLKVEADIIVDRKRIIQAILMRGWE